MRERRRDGRELGERGRGRQRRVGLPVGPEVGPGQGGEHLVGRRGGVRQREGVELERGDQAAGGDGVGEHRGALDHTPSIVG